MEENAGPLDPYPGDSPTPGLDPGHKGPNLPGMGSDSPLGHRDETESEPHQNHHLWLPWLLFRPSLFFTRFVAVSNGFLLVVACYAFGVAAAIDRAETQMVRRGSGSLLGDSSWTTYWGAVLGSGVLSALLTYALGGWWYRMRIEFCTQGPVEKKLARRVYIFASLVWAIPAVVYATWQTSAYESPIAASLGDDSGSMAILVFLFWSIFTSYKGVTSCFDVRRGAAIGWFLVAPGVAYAILVSFMFAAVISGKIMVKPDVDHPRQHTRASFVVSYPGNWFVDRSMDGYDPDTYFSIEPRMADCVAIVETSADVQALDLFLATRENLEQKFSIATWAPVPNWTGKSSFDTDMICHRGTLQIEGNDYVCRVFAVDGAGRSTVIWSLVLTSQMESMRPGLDQILETFRWR